jgi:hypothetical protein
LGKGFRKKEPGRTLPNAWHHFDANPHSNGPYATAGRSVRDECASRTSCGMRLLAHVSSGSSRRRLAARSAGAPSTDGDTHATQSHGRVAPATHPPPASAIPPLPPAPPMSPRPCHLNRPDPPPCTASR